YKNGKIIGGLGISGDTACTDHEIAKRVRDALHLNPPGGATIDDIVYSPPDNPSGFAHPVCLNTWRNGHFIGNEAPATYPFVPPSPCRRCRLLAQQFMCNSYSPPREEGNTRTPIPADSSGGFH